MELDIPISAQGSKAPVQMVSRSTSLKDSTPRRNESDKPPLLFLNSSRDRPYSAVRPDRKSINQHVQLNVNAKRRLMKSRRFQRTGPLPIRRSSAPTDLQEDHRGKPALSDICSIGTAVNLPNAEETIDDAMIQSLDDPAFSQVITLFDDIGSRISWPQSLRRNTEPSPFVDPFSTGSISTFLDSVELDPFATTATHFTRDMNAVLHHFLEIASPRVFVNRKQTVVYNKWLLSLAFSQPAVLFGVLAFAAADIQTKRGQLQIGHSIDHVTGDDPHQFTPDYSKYKLKAIQLLNRRLGDENEASESSTFYGIVRLLAIEIIVGNQDEILVHLKGLGKLAAIHGSGDGLLYTLMGSTLASNTIFAAAALTRSMPPGPLPMPPAPDPQLIRATISPTILYAISASDDPNLKEIGGILEGENLVLFLDHQIIEAYLETRELILFREFCAKTDPDLTAADERYFGYKLCKVHCILLSFPFQERGTEDGNSKQEACRIALIIFLHTQYMRQSSSSALYRSLTQQLTDSLQKSALVSLWAPRQEFWVWILFLGAHVSQGQVERPWFTMNLAYGLRSMGLREWTAVKKRLARVFYVERTFEESYQAIWQEVRLLMTAMSASEH